MANRGGSRAAATSKMDRFEIIVNGFKFSISNHFPSRQITAKTHL